MRLFECDVGVGNDTSVMQVIEPGGVRKQTVKDKDVAFFRYNWGEFFAALNTIVQMMSS